MGDIIAYAIVSVIIIGLVALIVSMLWTEKRKQIMDYKIERTKTIIPMVDVRIGSITRLEKDTFTVAKYRFYELRLKQLRGSDSRASNKEFNRIMDEILVFEEMILKR